MRKENGVTLIGLVVTIIVLIILASIGTYTGLNSVKEAKFTKFRTNLEIMQAQVDLLSEKYKTEIEEAETNGTTFTAVGKDIPSDLFSEEGGLSFVLEDIKNNYDSKASAEVSDYRYFDEEELKNLGVDYSETEFLVDLKNRIAIATKPLKYEGVLCYTINQPIVKGETPETGGFERTENVTVENIIYQKTSDGYQITLQNVKCSEYVSRYDVEYREANDKASKIERGITSNNYTFTVDKHGLYFIKVKDAAGKTTEREELVVSIYDGVKFNTATKVKMVKSIGATSVTVEEVAIPAGFTISGLENECAKTILGVKPDNEIRNTIDDGVVIYLNPSSVDWEYAYDVEYAQEEYDQFVWVPVPNAILDLSGNPTALSTEANIKNAVQNVIDTEGIYPMAIKKDETNYFGVLYSFSLDSTTNTVKVEPYSKWTPLATSAFREPAYLTSNGVADASKYNNVGITESPDSLQLEFNTMVDKVNSNKGFWVGRYETSNMNGGSSDTDNSYDETQQIDVVKGATEGVSGEPINWYRMYAQQKNYSKLALGSSTTVTSSMIWGSQWDQIMIWMKEVKNTVNTTNGEYYVINAVGMGNFEVSDDQEEGFAPTGNSENYKVKNVYDLAGNASDLTLEAHSVYERVSRGNSCYASNSTNTIAVYREYYESYDAWWPLGTIGSRSSLY